MDIGTVLRGAAAKVIGVDSEHISRFHTRRGELCTPLELLAIPSLAWNRMTGKANHTPWMAPRAVMYLDRLLRPEDVLLELGSGDSTAWYARRVHRVVSLEPSSHWAARVRARLAGHPNAEVREGPVSGTYLAALSELQPTVLIVDHSDEPRLTRTDAIRAALRNGAQPRVIVLDDSDRGAYAPVAELLAHWRTNRFTGFRGQPLRLTETTVFIGE